MTERSMAGAGATLVSVLCLVITLLADLSGSASRCDDDQFQCVNGECIYILFKCNLRIDCDDGSDEGLPACSAPNVTLRAGASLEAHVHYRKEHDGVGFFLCDTTECSTLWLHSAGSPGQSLSYWSASGCNTEGELCSKDNLHRERKRESFAPGLLRFVVERRGSQLLVWLSDSPARAVSVPVEEGQTRLRIRPEAWRSDMPVQFKGRNEGCQGDDQFQCFNKDCIHIRFKCNGRNDCSDGSDELLSTCTAPSADLPTGVTLEARVLYKQEHEGVGFIVCGNATCSRLWVHNPGANDGSLWHWPAIGCNTEGERCTRDNLNPGEKRGTFTPGELLFVVERRESELAVWLSGNADKAVTVAAEKGQTRLKVRPEVWRSVMPVQFRELGSKVAPAPVETFQALPNGGENCGFQHIGGLIKGGRETEPGEFPWMAQMFYLTENKDHEAKCSGSLISTRYVLTAAHCLQRGLSYVLLGENDMTKSPDCVLEAGQQRCAPPELTVVIESRVAHPEYDRSTKANDIALLLLEDNVTYSDYVRPVCLPGSGSVVVGERLWTAGWGLKEDFESSLVRRKVLLPVVDPQICSQRLRRQSISTQEICAGGEKGRDSCPGDSGGPLMQLEPTSGRWTIHGIVSFGAKDACGLGIAPSIYTRVQHYVSWISDTIARGPR